MWELLWLLLPVAAISGWWIAKRDSGRSTHHKTPGLSSHYFKGLNYLLNEQPDKAIEVFLKMLEVDSETAETHLALGNLFRRRGEVDRAIRIHQNLIARPSLSRPLRTLALLELGQDYMRAGLFDRAETLFLELIEMNDHTAPALRHLIDIYQQEKEWDKAIAVTKRWEEVSGKSCSEVIAHYYCELAEQARQQRDLDRAARMLERALEFDQNCVRASLLQGEMEVESGDCKVAIRAFKRVEQQDPDYLPEVIEPLLDCYNTLGQTGEIIAYLKQILVKHSSISLILALAELMRRQEGDDAAANFITEQLRKRPSVRGLDRLIELNLAHSEGAARDNLLILRDLVKKLLEEKPVYKCNHCGFVGRSLHWQCPSCKTWNSMKPIHGVEGE